MGKIWYHKKSEEVSNEYTFDGNLYVTRRIKTELEVQEIQNILNHIWNRVRIEGGIDYLQIYYNDIGEKIFVIDNINKDMKYTRSKKWVEENDYLTIMFADEY